MATLADDYTNLAGVYDAMREAVGHVDQTVLLPDTMVSKVATRVLRRLNLDFSLRGYGTFNTVAAQQSYTPLPAGAYQVLRAFWPRSGLCAEPYRQFVAELAEVLDEFGTVVVPEPAMLALVARRDNWLRKLDPAGANIFNGVTVYLDPVPSSAVAVVFEYTAPRFAAVLDIDEQHYEPFFALSSAFLHESLAAGAGGVSNVSDTSEGTSITTQSPAHHLTLARENRSRYAATRPPADVDLTWS